MSQFRLKSCPVVRLTHICRAGCDADCTPLKNRKKGATYHFIHSSGSQARSNGIGDTYKGNRKISLNGNLNDHQKISRSQTDTKQTNSCTEEHIPRAATRLVVRMSFCLLFSVPKALFAPPAPDFAPLDAICVFGQGRGELRVPTTASNRRKNCRLCFCAGARPARSIMAHVEERNQDATVWCGDLEKQVDETLLWELFLQCGPIGS